VWLGAFLTGVRSSPPSMATVGRAADRHSFTSVSLDPPLILCLCQQRQQAVTALLHAAARFCVNISVIGRQAICIVRVQPRNKFEAVEVDVVDEVHHRSAIAWACRLPRH